MKHWLWERLGFGEWLALGALALVAFFSIWLALAETAPQPDSWVTPAEQSAFMARQTDSGSKSPAPDPVLESAKECFPTYTNLEMKVYESLKGDSWVASSDQATIVGLTSTKMSACAVQRKVLDVLAQYPRDQRSEALAAIVDAVERRH